MVIFSKTKEQLLVEISVLQNRKIEIPVKKHNFSSMPYTESRIVCRENEIERLKNLSVEIPEICVNNTPVACTGMVV